MTGRQTIIFPRKTQGALHIYSYVFFRPLIWKGKSYLLKIIAILTPSDCDDKFVNGLMPLAGLFSIGVTIWGSIVVFGAYSSWTYAAENKDNNDENECKIEKAKVQVATDDDLIKGDCNFTQHELLPNFFII